MSGLRAVILLSVFLRRLTFSFTNPAFSFQSRYHEALRPLKATTSADIEPQIWSVGYSSNADLLEAIQEATELAKDGLPKDGKRIDLAVVTVSSLYDGQSSPSVVVPAVLSSASTYGEGIQHLVGSTTGGVVSSIRNEDFGIVPQDQSDPTTLKACQGVENEGTPGVSVTMAILPNVELKTFHVLGEDVPDDVGRVPPEIWKSAVGLKDFEGATNPSFFLIPTPSFQSDLDDFLAGIGTAFPASKSFGGIASTVSSLSRARLFRYDASDSNGIATLADGCVGIGMAGDIEVKTMVAVGTKPVGGIYRIVKGQDSTISAIVLDETATQEEAESLEMFEEDEDEEEPEDMDAKARAAAAYAKAAIPKPVLAEANFLMKSLSDDDQLFMRKALLIGLERGGSVGRTPSELARLAEGQGHRFTVYQVASAGMKDGSVTLPLGSVDIKPGTRLRFFVRESDFAKREVKSLWSGHKKKVLEETVFGDSDKKQFEPAICMLLPTLDRGNKFFGGKPGYESDTVTSFQPAVPCIAGYFNNGVVGKLDDEGQSSLELMLHGSATSYVLIGSASRRPIYSPQKAQEAEQEAAEEGEEDKDVAGAATRTTLAQSVAAVSQDEKAPRAENGELILKRREIHSGRALTVSTVEWSVAEKTATPTSTLEGFMWDKETEVDRFRERVPLQNLVSQCKLSRTDPTKPKPRDWIGPVKEAAKDGFVIIPECKRAEPSSGSIRKRYDVAKLVKQFVSTGVPALSVNCDPVLFGGSLDDVALAREASAKAALEKASEDGVVVPPILASDLVLYPYQLYKLSLGGADAVNLVGGALASKDLLYLTKIASSLGLQVLLTVTSTVQIDALTKLSRGSVSGLIVSNRELEDFSFDMTGDQVLELLKSESLEAFREHHGEDVPIFAEGRVGIIERDGDYTKYMDDLKDAGATGAIVGGALAIDVEGGKTRFEEMLTV